MYSLVCLPDESPGSPSGGLGTVPRIVPPDGSSDSPSGGPRNLGRSHGQPFGRHTESRTVTRIALREAHSNSPTGKKDEPTTSLRGCKHTVSSIRRGFAVQNLFPPEPRQPFGSTKLFRWEGERKPDHAWHLYVKKSECGECISTSFYRKNQGVGWDSEIPKNPPYVTITRA
jgi:hypothetical protein